MTCNNNLKEFKKMKTNRLFIYAAALMMTAACAKEVAPETMAPEADNAPEYAVSFTAYTENAPELKATLGTSTSGMPQTFWEDGDLISVYSSANMSTSARSSYLFSTSLEQNSASATFGYNGEDFQPSGKYMAIYPHRDGTRAVNFTAQPYGTDPSLFPYEGDAYRMAVVDVPASQTMVAGGFDRTSMVMTAVTENTSELHFKNAVALVKFKVSDPVQSGQIASPDALISGRFRADITAADMIPHLVDYRQATAQTVDFVAASGETLAPGTEYYVAVRPTDLPNGFMVYINGKVVKSYTAEQVPAFERSKIYDLGTLTVPAPSVETKTLDFDFTIAANMTGWHTSKTPGGAEASDLLKVPYAIDGVTYEFICANPLEATMGFPYYNGTAVFIGKYRFLGLPVIEGYCLTSVTVVNGSSKANGSRAVGVTTTLAKQDGSTENGQEFVAGGETKPLSGDAGTSVSFNLSGTKAGTMYYLRNATIDTIISSMRLIYTEAE